MDNKIVKVIFKEGWETMYSNDLTKCDYGQVLQIEGITLPDGNVEVHFSLTEHNGEAPISIGSVKDNIITVDIPDFILAKENTYNSSYEAYAWIYVTDGESGRTIRKIVFTIDTRAEPTTNVPEDQKDKFLQEVRQVLAETKEVAQSVRDDADKGKFNGQQGDPGKDGKSAYQYAVEGGFKGTEQEFIDLMAQAGHVDLTGYVSKEEHEAELLKAMVKVTTDKSAFHHITDSANMKVVDFGMEGITEQDTTSGKNVYSGGDVSGTEKIVVNIEPIPAGKYTFSANVVSSDTDKEQCSVRLYGENNAYGGAYYITRGTRQKFSFTINNPITRINFYASTDLDVSVDDTFSFTDIQIEEYTDGTATEYEPFTNGASPNPTHPQDIKLAGVLNPKTGRYEHKCCVGNKNWFDLKVDNVTKLAYGSIVDIDGGIELTYTNIRDCYCILNYLLLPNTTYTVSVNMTISYTPASKFKAIGIYTDNGEWYNPDIASANYTNGKIVLTFTTPDVENNIYICLVGTAYNNNVSGVTTFTDLQIEIADTPTAHTPHASQPFTLTSDRPLTKWDKLVKRDGVYGWSIWSGILNVIDSTGFFIRDCGGLVAFQKINVPSIAVRNECFCEMFRGVENPQNLIPQAEAIDWLGTNMQFYMNKERNILDLANFGSYLSENPITVIYHAAEEQAFHPLPDEEQTLLNNLETYYGVTNIYNEQGCPMWLTYVADQELHWNQKLLQIQQAII